MEEELKSILRSVLGSNPRTTRVFALNRDFKELYGKEFPFKSLGYKSFLEYLKSIPDTLQVSFNINTYLNIIYYRCFATFLMFI